MGRWYPADRADTRTSYYFLNASAALLSTIDGSAESAVGPVDEVPLGVAHSAQQLEQLVLLRLAEHVEPEPGRDQVGPPQDPGLPEVFGAKIVNGPGPFSVSTRPAASSRWTMLVAEVGWTMSRCPILLIGNSPDWVKVSSTSAS